MECVEVWLGEIAFEKLLQVEVAIWDRPRRFERIREATVGITGRLFKNAEIVQSLVPSLPMVKIHGQLCTGLLRSLNCHIDIEHQNLLAVWSTRFLFESICVNLRLPFKTVGSFIKRPHFLKTLLMFSCELVLARFNIWIFSWFSIY